MFRARGLYTLQSTPGQRRLAVEALPGGRRSGTATVPDQEPSQAQLLLHGRRVKTEAEPAAAVAAVVRQG